MGKAGSDGANGRARTGAFVASLLWLLGLGALFFVYVESDWFRDVLPRSYGHIPVEAPWFGALGGSIFSFAGVFGHSNEKWDSRFNFWYFVRPLMGAATGGVACILLIVILRAANGSTTTTVDATTFDAVAFVFGYAENSFRQLIEEATNLLLRPGKK